MTLARRTAELLHEDHQATLAVIESLEQLIARARRKTPDIADAGVKKTLTLAATAIEQEVSAHFTFEETELFTRLEEAGDIGIGTHLRDEHAAILPLGVEVAERARAALADGWSDQAWGEFRAVAGALVERMYAHIQKEEMALLPMLEDLLDPETDMALATAYSENL